MESASVTNFVPKGSPIVIMVVVCLFGFFLAVGACWGVAVAEKSRHTGETPNYAGVPSSGEITFPIGAVNLDQIAAQLDEWIAAKTPGDSPLRGLGKEFVMAGKANNINPAFMIATSGQESSFGTVFAANPESNNNYANIKCMSSRGFSCNHGFTTFSSWAQCVEEHAKLLNRRYLSKGLVTIALVQEDYCPSSDRGCPEWTAGVTTTFNSIISAVPALKPSISSVSGGPIVNIMFQEYTNFGLDNSAYRTGENKVKYNNFDGSYWCALFAVWVYHQAGVKDMPNIALSRGLYSWFKDHGHTTFTDPSQAKPGDILIFRKRGSSTAGHTAMVYQNTGSGIVTIEGNCGRDSDDKVCKRSRSYTKLNNNSDSDESGGSLAMVGFARW